MPGHADQDASAARGGRKASSKTGGRDPRFAKFETDPLYRLPSKKQTHVSVDSRFARMFSDDAFTSRAKVDRYGRTLPKPKAGKGLDALYRVEEGGRKTESRQRKAAEAKPSSRVAEPSSGEEGFGEEEEEEEEGGEEEEDDDGGVSISDDSEVKRELKRLEKGPDYDPARDGGFSESSSEEDSTDESEDEEADFEESGLAARQEEDIPIGDITRRLAVVNLDWDNIRAVDLMAVLKSFAPVGGRIRKVTVYPSEFGKDRLEKEAVEGPPKELFASRNPKAKAGRTEEDISDSEDEDEEEEDERIKKSLLQEDKGEDFDSDQLRAYQLERLRYYYAVVECSSEDCAEEIYNAVDGTEYLSTANFFDLRFIPDDTDFSSDEPRDSCTEVPEGYRPNEFSTSALQHSKVVLTWDADDSNRKEAQKRAFSRAEMDENDLKTYLASDSSDDEDNVLQPEVVDATEVTIQETDGVDKFPGEEQEADKKESARQRMRALLGLPAEPAQRKSKKNEPVGDMQITFTSGLSGSKGGPVFENEPIDPEETTLERYVRKEKERKAKRKEKMKANRRGEVGQEEEDTKEEEEEREASESEKDLGFDDPFFTEPVSHQTAKKSSSKEEKRKKRAEREAEEARKAVEREGLEHLMAGEQAADSGVRHFDISELKKAEKTLRKTKGKRAKLKAGEKAAIEAKEADDFEMNVADSRFSSRMDQPQFAVDPSHPSFSKTEGMQGLLAARREKRARETLGEDEEPRSGKRKKGGARNEDDQDLKSLVQRVKGKTKR